MTTLNNASTTAGAVGVAEGVSVGSAASAASVSADGAAGITCPQCRQALRQVHRHFGDRLLALFVPLHRFRCTDPRCGWEGLLRGHLPRPAHYLPMHLLDPARAADEARR